MPDSGRRFSQDLHLTLAKIRFVPAEYAAFVGRMYLKNDGTGKASTKYMCGSPAKPLFLRFIHAM